jgi:thiol-disulfide isomerase/thioredoxin
MRFRRPANLRVPLLALLIGLSGVPVTGDAGELRHLEPAAAPPLQLPDTAGVTRHLGDWRGRVVLVNFWASWCPPCLQEMPSIQRLAEHLRGRPFAVVTVNVAEMDRRAAGAMTRLGLDFPILLDADASTFRAWGGKGLPTSALLDHKGMLRYLGLGPLEWDDPEVVEAVEDLLREAAGGAHGG